MIELKKDRTPREVVAQALDYGSWVGKLSADEVAGVYASHTSNGVGFVDAFRERFGIDLPETINESHSLGHRVFVNIPQTGYVGVGIVTASAQPVKEFSVEIDGGKQTPILNLPLRADMTRDVDDPEKCEYLVHVRWLETLRRDSGEVVWRQDRWE